ncbi:MAG: hypothetical protein IT327_16005 [Anaerolineae bacterium]|nr:hypothetical protein [Anaerolineae bacterium]
MDGFTPDKETASQPTNEGDHIQVGNIQHAQAVAIGAGATAVYQGLTVEEVAILVAELKRVDQPKVWDGRIPYLGLTAFRENDAQFFFGRESLVDDLLERLQQSNFITIAGPSGSGKSSVARAGLFYALRRGRLPKSDRWRLATMQPRGEPLGQTAASIERLTHTPGSGDHIRHNGLTNPLALHEQIQTLLSDDPGERFVLLVDQFEEIFTQTKDEAVREAFIQLLTVAAQAEDSRATILVALRSDFISHCARYPDLRALMSQQFQLVGAMAGKDLAKAITLPALEVGAEIDSALVSRIMADMKGEPGALPLMSFALRDLFEAEKTQPGEPLDLTLPEYLHHGGLDSALERHANKVFHDFSDEQKVIAQTIFSKLIEVGQGRVDTRRTATFSELVPAGVSIDSVADVVGKLAQEDIRLITTSGGDSHEERVDDLTTQAMVTIAHEKLIDAWPWLRQLVDENREMIVLQNQINNDARAWDKEEDPGFLYRGGRLLQVEEKLDQLQPNLDDLSQRFIQASLEAKAAEQQAEVERIQKEETLSQERANASRFRRLTRWLSVAAGVAVVATIVALLFLNVALQQSVQANAESTRAFENQMIAEAARAETEQQRKVMSLIAGSQSLMNVTAPDNQSVAQARLMAAAAVQIDEEALAGQNRNSTISWNYHLVRVLAAPYQLLDRLDSSPSKASVVAWDSAHNRLVWTDCLQEDSGGSCVEGEILVWDTNSRQLVHSFAAHGDIIESLAWSADGRYLASAACGLEDEYGLCAGGEIIIWDTDNWQPLHILSELPSQVTQMAWSEDHWLASVDSDGALTIWDPEAGQPLQTLVEHTTWINALAWSTDGRLVSADVDGTIVIWDTTTWQALEVLDTWDSIQDVAWSMDNSRLAVAYVTDFNQRDHIKILETTGWQTVSTLSEHTRYAANLNWDQYGQRLVSTTCVEGNHLFCSKSILVVWDTTSWQPLTVLGEHESDIRSLAWNDDSSRLVSAGWDGIIIIWDTAEWQPPTLTTSSPGYSVAWNEEGTQLAYGNTDGTITIWDTADWQPLHTLTEHPSSVYSLAWSADGRLASGDDVGNIIIWDTATWQPLKWLAEHANSVSTLAWNSDDSRLASAGCGQGGDFDCSQGEILIWDTSQWQVLETLTEHSAKVWSVAWHPNASRLASTACGDQRGFFCSRADIIIWDTASWQPAVTLTDHRLLVYSVGWNADGTRFASAGDDGNIIIWDPDGWQPLFTLSDHSAAVREIAWHPDGSLLASASFDNSVIIWDVTSSQPLIPIYLHTSWVWSVAWNRDGSRLASSSGGTVFVTQPGEVDEQNCRMAYRNFTWEEWQRLFPDTEYRQICPQWPIHPTVPEERRPKTTTQGT